jgi:hypothetical protein
MSGEAGKGSERRAYDRKKWEHGADLYYANQRNAKARKMKGGKDGRRNNAK